MHPHGIDEQAFVDLFTPDRPVVFAFHGYQRAIHEIVHGRPAADRFHVRGFNEQGTTTTPFDMVVLNGMSRYHPSRASGRGGGHERQESGMQVGMIGLEGADLKLVHHPTPNDLDAYERLLVDAMAGDAMLFAREDGVEAAWCVVQPILEDPTPVREYAPGTWGPDEADALTADVGGWHSPLGGAGTS